MEFIKNIRNSIAYTTIEKKAEKLSRQQSFFSLKTAQNIGILFDLNKVSNFETVNKFKKELVTQNKKVEVMAWINSNKIPDTKLKQHLTLYINRDIKTKGVSTNETINNFISTPFDLLLVLNDTNSLATHYIVSLSKASCKVGALKNCHKALDFIIEMPKSATIEKLIQEIKKYII